jgi:RND family efflux transporter MFP subunit
MTDKLSRLNELRIARDEPVPPRPRRLGVLLILALMAGGASLAAINWSSNGVRAADQPVALQTATPGPSGGMTQDAILEAAGLVVPRRQATVASKITARVTAVLITEGDHVEAGQIIARLDDSNVEATLALARANYMAADAAFRDAQPIFERSASLLKAGAGTAQAFDLAKGSYNAAMTGREVARRALEVAERNEDDTVIRAPFAGVVTDISANEGEIVSPITAGGGFTRTGIGTIVDMTSLEIVVDVNESFINVVRPGQRAAVHLDAYPEWKIEGRVAAIVPTVDRNKGTIKVRIALTGLDARILPQMSARVSIYRDVQVAADQSGATVVPASMISSASAADSRNSAATP